MLNSSKVKTTFYVFWSSHCLAECGHQVFSKELIWVICSYILHISHLLFLFTYDHGWNILPGEEQERRAFSVPNPWWCRLLTLVQAHWEYKDCFLRLLYILFAHDQNLNNTWSHLVMLGSFSISATDSIIFSIQHFWDWAPKCVSLIFYIFKKYVTGGAFYWVPLKTVHIGFISTDHKK